jgi:LmbE family N-acetylglucosaminyl deacetylase
MNPYQDFVRDYAALLERAKRFQLGGFPPARRPPLGPKAPVALFFSPHPDDECISGGLALRLMREAGVRVHNVAVTQGSNRQRQAARYSELQAACEYLGFGLLPTAPTGLEKINPKTRAEDPAHWGRCVNVIVGLLREHRPTIVFCPHERDWNSTHIGTHLLVTDALRALAGGFEGYLVETEFWGQMDDPNLMIEIHETDLADMITALTFHVGEVKRNPYHLLLAGWMTDNVRRGSELVGGQGGAAPEFKFAVLNRLRKWKERTPVRFFEGGRQLALGADLRALFSLG